MVIVSIITKGDFTEEQIAAFKVYRELDSGSIQLFQEMYGYQGEEERRSKAIIRVTKEHYDSFKKLLKKIISEYDWKISINQSKGTVLMEVKGHFNKDGNIPINTIKSITDAINYIQNEISK